MRLPFCDHHISAFFESQTKNQKPLDLALSEYFRGHKSIGANDRRQIGEAIYGMVRWKSLIDYFCPSNHHLDRLKCFRSLSLEECRNNLAIPEAARMGLTDFLFQRLKKIYGTEKARELGQILNTQAPIAIRANLLKTNREELLAKWEGKFEVSPSRQLPTAIRFKKREPLFTLPEFKEGLFEVQDEGSQLVAALVAAKPGDHVLDYCSGSGGKTLAFAPNMEGKGQIYLHDNRPWILIEARKRLNRAGIQNVQFVLPKKKMNWVLADVPCSGTGTLRRNPDAKWKIDSAMIDRLIVQQREIVHEALQHLRTDGQFVYATCSILPEENEEQIAYFMKTYSLELAAPPLSLLPQMDECDGFFAAVLKKQNLV